jgi:hypothetical protein
MLEKRGYLPKILLKLQDKLPLCVACQFGTAHQCPCHTKGSKSGSIQKPDQIKSGDGVSVDQIISAQPDLIPQMAGFRTRKQIWGHQKQHYVPYYLSIVFFYLSNMLLGS